VNAASATARRTAWPSSGNPRIFSIVSRSYALVSCGALSPPGIRALRIGLSESRNHTIGHSWEEVAHAAIEECKRHGARLLVVDTLAQFAGLVGDEENNSGDAMRAMQPLQLAAAQGTGILVQRHERKSGGPVGESGRGSSAYAGAVDIVLSLRRPEGNTRPTVRAIHAISRFGEAPDELLVELTAGGYVALGTAGDVAAQEAEGAILAGAPRAEGTAVTLDALLCGTTVKRPTAQRAIRKLLAAGHLIRLGAGRRGDPFRYWRP
jgi:hypothetical protein